MGSPEGAPSARGIVLKLLLWAVVSAAAVLTIALLVDWDRLRFGAAELSGQPWLVAALVAGYTAAFFLRAVAWRALMSHPAGIFSLFTALQAALLGNHLLPFKLGEGVRPLILGRENVPFGQAVATTAVARVADFACLLAIATVAAFTLPPFRRRSDVGAGVDVAGGRGGWGRGGADVHSLAPLSSRPSKDLAAPFHLYPFPAS